MPETPEEKAAREAAEKAEAERKAKEEEESSESEEELTVEQLKAKLDEKEKHIKSLNKESAERRIKLEAFEKAEQERKQAELTEVQKAEAKAKAAEERQIALEAENKTLKLEGAFAAKVRAMKLDFANENAEKDAFQALDLEAVGEDYAGLEDEIKRLVKERSYYFGKESQQQHNNDGSAKGKINVRAANEKVIATKKRSITPL